MCKCVLICRDGMGLNMTCRLGPGTELPQVWAAIDVVVSHQSPPPQSHGVLTESSGQRRLVGHAVSATALSIRGSVILILRGKLQYCHRHWKRILCESVKQLLKWCFVERKTELHPFTGFTAAVFCSFLINTTRLALMNTSAMSQNEMACCDSFLLLLIL